MTSNPTAQPISKENYDEILDQILEMAKHTSQKKVRIQGMRLLELGENLYNKWDEIHHNNKQYLITDYFQQAQTFLQNNEKTLNKDNESELNFEQYQQFIVDLKWSVFFAPQDSEKFEEGQELIKIGEEISNAWNKVNTPENLILIRKYMDEAQAYINMSKNISLFKYQGIEHTSQQPNSDIMELWQNTNSLLNLAQKNNSLFEKSAQQSVQNIIKKIADLRKDYLLEAGTNQNTISSKSYEIIKNIEQQANDLSIILNQYNLTLNGNKDRIKKD